MGAILENVGGGHGGRAKAMDEEGFEFAFSEVETDEGKGECLKVGGPGAVGCGG